MKWEQKTIRVGAAVIAFACVLRFCGSGLVQDITALLMEPSVASVLFYAGTGWVCPRASPETPTEPTVPPVTQPSPAIFTQEDAALVSVTDHPGYGVDVPALLETPLNWELTGAEPAVLILHSHTCESYENTEGYTQTADYRTTDEDYNMVSIGKELARCLEDKGIRVLHDTTVHDYPSYNDAYDLSRQTAQKHLQAHPSIRLVLDIHRDAYTDSAGNQLSSTLQIQGQSAARLMIVAGTDGYGEGHENWQENLALAVKLQAALEGLYPGLCRNIALRSSAFNQDLSPGALLIEVGTAGDTRQEALHAARLLAEGIAQLAHGAN